MSNPNSEASSNVTLSPGQAKFLYWFVGTAPILKAMTTITTYLGSRKAKLKELAKLDPMAKTLSKDAFTDIYRNVVSDFARQTVTCSFQLMSYFLVGDAIKAILKHVYSKKPADQQDPGMQQVLMQVIPLSVQVIATVLSRNFGAADLQALFDVDPKTGHYRAYSKGRKGFLEWPRKHIGPFIEKHLKDSKGQLMPFKASMIGTGAMIVYFGSLVGLLYGLSSGLEKAFPNFFQTRKPKKNQPAVQKLEIPQAYPAFPMAHANVPRNSQSPYTTRFPRPYPTAVGFPAAY